MLKKAMHMHQIVEQNCAENTFKSNQFREKDTKFKIKNTYTTPN